MLFSEFYKVTRTPVDKWFNPLMDHDTKLFIDPFLIFQDRGESSDFGDAHQKVVDFFNRAFELVAKSSGNPNSIHYLRALGMLIFPEVKELCLGYSKNSTKGLGSNVGFSKVIADAIWNSIKSGISKIEHFEELSIFDEGIGADRISDMAANILKSDLIVYTQQICNLYKIPTEEIRIRNSSFNYDLEVWNHDKVKLPKNPFTQRAIILVPEQLLRPLPTLNAEDFWDYVCINENQVLRNNLSAHIKGKIKKEDIVKLARSNLDIVQRYVERTEKLGSSPYDLQEDPNNYHKWYSLGKEIADRAPLKLIRPTNEGELLKLVDDIVDNFIHFIELQKGYELLWYKDSPRSEASSQRLFLGISWAHCKANDIDINKEENLGSGPVDFKLSRGFSKRVLIEVKLAKNTKFWDGLLAQLPQYLRTEQTDNGIFLIIIYNDKDLKRIKNISKVISDLNKQTELNVRYKIIDARHKASASKLKQNIINM